MTKTIYMKYSTIFYLLFICFLLSCKENSEVPTTSFPTLKQNLNKEYKVTSLTRNQFLELNKKIYLYNQYFNEAKYDSLIHCIDPKLFKSLTEQDFINALKAGHEMNMKVTVLDSLKTIKSYSLNNKLYTLGTYPSSTILSTNNMDSQSKDFYIENINKNPRMKLLKSNNNVIEFMGDNYMLFISDLNTQSTTLLEYNPDQLNLLYDLYGKELIDLFNLQLP